MKEVYRLNNGYLPRVYDNNGLLTYVIPVDVSFVSTSYEFTISEQDFSILKNDESRFRILNFILHTNIQKTFGPGHPAPRKYTQQEFDICKNICLYYDKIKLDEYVETFLNEHNFNQATLDLFLKS